MPANVVKSKRDERLWEEAKTQADRQGHAKDWAYIMGIYKRMKDRSGGWRLAALKRRRRSRK